MVTELEISRAASTCLKSIFMQIVTKARYLQVMPFHLLSMNLHIPVDVDMDHMNADVHVPVYIFFSNSYVVRSVSCFIVLFHQVLC